MASPVIFPVIRVLLQPALVAVSLIFLIIGIALHFSALPKPFSDSLAIFSITVSLILYTGIGNEITSAGRIGTSLLFVHGFPP